MSARLRLYVAWVLLIITLVGWPLSIFTFARDEPPVILSISWLALTLTAWDIIATADVRVKQDQVDA